LARPKIRRRLPGPDAERFTTALRLLATEVEDPVDVPRVVTDPADDYLIALARHESVHTLITDDKAVLAAPAPDLLIQTPRQFVDLLSSTR
jgi:predicted nucleic acid-binding protein